MRVSEIMTNDLACCTVDTPLREVAQMMVDNDCGEIPVRNADGEGRLVGVITDRDIVCRAIAEGRNPLALTARECMSTPVITVTPEDTVKDCCELMEAHQIRRIPVVDELGIGCGIVSLADIAVYASNRYTTEVIREVSKPGTSPSNVAP
jgi:CBS domain-containing protein